MFKVLRCSLPVAFLIVLTLLCPSAYSNGETMLFVDPPSIVDYSYSPNTVFTIDVSLSSVFDLHVCEFNLTYDSTVVGCLGMLVGPLVNEPYDTEFGWNDYVGIMWFNITYRIPVTSEPPVTVSTIYFIVKKRGQTPLDIYYSRLLDSLGNPFSRQVSDGYFRNFNPYDINLDLTVDMRDIGIAAKAFGSYPGHPRWNPIADVDHDDDVDLFDISLIASHFGEN